jgi:tetraacyldisaccharide 4''-kinase
MASDRQRQGIHDTFLKLISGEYRGILGVPGRAFLRGLEIPYTGVTSLRNAGYERQLLKSERLSVPVISVGNLTAGGTGKTPVVYFLAKWLEAEGYCPAIIMRGYRAQADLKKNHLVADENGIRLSQSEAGDEATQLAEQLKGVPIWIGADRVNGGRRAIAESRANVLIMDDGFQHRRLFREMDIVLIDALKPWGYGHVLPRGLLRESIAGIQRADAVLITRADVVSESELKEIEMKIRKYHSEVPILRTSHRPSQLRDLLGRKVCDCVEWQGKSVFLFCGLGNPSGFFLTAKEAGFQVIGEQVFPDHHSYEEKELENLCEMAKKSGADALLTTEKDGVKLAGLKDLSLPIWQLGIEVFFYNQEDTLKDVIIKKCRLKK